MQDIKKYIDKSLNLQSFEILKNEDFYEIRNYYQNAKADAIHCFERIKKFLKKDKNILEIGGGVHLLTSFLNQEYKIDVTTNVITPDPTDTNSRDETFISFVALRASCFLDQSTYRTKAATEGIRAGLGPAQLNVSGNLFNPQ